MIAPRSSVAERLAPETQCPSGAIRHWVWDQGFNRSVLSLILLQMKTAARRERYIHQTKNNEQIVLTPSRRAALGPIGPPPCLSYVVVPAQIFAHACRDAPFCSWENFRTTVVVSVLGKFSAWWLPCQLLNGFHGWCADDAGDYLPTRTRLAHSSHIEFAGIIPKYGGLGQAGRSTLPLTPPGRSVLEA
jgi:hypothetical protein